METALDANAPNEGGPVVPRPRITNACEACRSAKVKCQASNQLGICKRCLDSKRECVFKTGPRTRRPRQSKRYVFSYFTLPLNQCCVVPPTPDPYNPPKIDTHRDPTPQHLLPSLHPQVPPKHSQSTSPCPQNNPSPPPSTNSASPTKASSAPSSRAYPPAPTTSTTMPMTST
ncbi:hypothetical protein QBC34DRAFT_409527 [Podospora aff. communis PSN243]|uniref:Zn(2)-C6 fungal-type domain-containing protein n=1 Tax=Podospora aff. communis PSN243 TaxID=3040156 RepID=A0AAV9GG89_9PEZI|nr:hypothetical protein QBC34DRAFT_409527 [Podospora aff. communis PSN243]